MIIINPLEPFKPSLVYTTKSEKLRSILLMSYLFYRFSPSLFGGVILDDDIEFNNFSITNFSKSYGYVCEVHKNITTQDGYVLDLHRIPFGRNQKGKKKNRTPVLLMHGLGGSAENFIITGPENGLAYLFADRGYDVWMGNSRGSPHSKRHLELDPNSTEYWDFSWHETGMFDLPAIIDYILGTTKKQKILYLGHSQGTTAFFVLMANKPEYNKHIELMLALAPSAFEGKPPYLEEPYLSTHMESLETFRILSRLGELGKGTRDYICNNKYSTEEFCNFMILILSIGGGLDTAQLDFTKIDLLQKIFGVSKSFRQVMHYHQSALSGGFNHYDFGRETNLEKYNSKTPPPYNLNNVKAPIALFYGKSDTISTPPNVERLGKILPNVVLQYLIPYEGFTHLDFILAEDINELLYNEMFRFIDGFRKKNSRVPSSLNILGR